MACDLLCRFHDKIYVSLVPHRTDYPSKRAGNEIHSLPIELRLNSFWLALASSSSNNNRKTLLEEDAFDST